MHVGRWRSRRVHHHLGLHIAAAGKVFPLALNNIGEGGSAAVHLLLLRLFLLQVLGSFPDTRESSFQLCAHRVQKVCGGRREDGRPPNNSTPATATAATAAASHLEKGLEIVHDAIGLQLPRPHALLQAKINHVEAKSRRPVGEPVFTKLGRAEVREVYSPGKVNIEHERQVLNELSRV